MRFCGEDAAGRNRQCGSKLFTVISRIALNLLQDEKIQEASSKRSVTLAGTGA